MGLLAGTRLGAYEILAPLGAGGMGVVYKARDTRLDRLVAVKVLAPEASSSSERLAHIEREGHLLASLNHSNIAAIYGLEHSDDGLCLVMELAHGEILRGPLPVQEALDAARQIAEALEYAHERGVIHRDLKPANVKITPEGKVKVLDFGLAKALETGVPADRKDSPTLTVEPTREGVILGTPAYMSPEQARGKPLDRRTDIWSFGCVLFELLTGKRAFPGATVPDISAAILARDPEWTGLPASTPPQIRRLLRRCLEKDPQRRLQHMGDARIEIDECLASPAAPESQAANPSRLPGWTLAIIVAVAAGIAGWHLKPSPRPQVPAVTRTVALLPAGDHVNMSSFPAIALSPDGTRLVYAGVRNGAARLFVRRIDQFEATPIEGTEGAVGPFFSPDGQWVGFFAAGKLKKVWLAGGSSVTICDAVGGRGATWGSDDTIVFTPSMAYNVGLWRVSAAGGKPEVLTQPDPSQDETSHRWPEFLPDGKTLLFTIWSSVGFGNARVATVDLKSGRRETLLKSAANARLLPAGYLVFARLEGLLAVPFDTKRLAVTGQAFPIVSDIVRQFTSGGAQFALCPDALAYVPGPTQLAGWSLVSVDRNGIESPLNAPQRAFMTPRLSPDGRRVVTAIAEGTNFDLWICELERGTLTRLTSAESSEYFPIWTPDGKRVTFTSNRDGPLNLYWMSADGGPAEQLTTGSNPKVSFSWSQDGQSLAFQEIHPSTGSDIWILSMSPQRERSLFLRSAFSESNAEFSPDGQWLAYVSNESGRGEVYVTPFSGSGKRWQISTDGGSEPKWNPNGQELIYRNRDEILAVNVTTVPSAGKPRRLFQKHYADVAGGRNYDISRDGQRFVFVNTGETDPSPSEIHLVWSYAEELNRFVRGVR